MSERIGSIVIESVEPELDAGRYPVKRIAGEQVEVRADIFKEGHDVLMAVVRYRQVSPSREACAWAETPMSPVGNDAWTASFPVPRNGLYQFGIEAWPDTFRTWTSELKRKVEAGRKVESELLEGAALAQGASERATRAKAPQDAQTLAEAAKALRGPAPVAIMNALDPALMEVASRHADRSVASRYDRELPVFVDRPRAQTGAWYEFFPRSAGKEGRHGTFKDCEALLPTVAAMGFDVIYLPPIHPIGKTARKGKNNTLNATPEDVGSPWAIGGAEGGHKSVHPALGTLEDFRHLVRKAAEAGIEVAIDIAFQCSPDHPYLKEHPEWFYRRPDGTVKTAENPPKRYEDIVNFDFLGPAREALWTELRSVVLFWIEQGVTLFRVDNPHTKPISFWKWLIQSVQEEHPGAVFLSEAFTRPKVMKALAKVGFSQSYTYFTWRNFRKELQEYLEELTRSPVADYMRGNLWPNTPDILPELLQHGGPPAFKLRLALAATLSSSYGIYSGYEACEGRPVKEGAEEYLDSEKYQLVRWDRDRPGNIVGFISAINRIRRQHPALLQFRNLRFHESSNERVLCYSKRTADGKSQVLVAVSLDPYAAQESTIGIPIEHLGLSADEDYQVQELLTGERALWKGATAQVKLTPESPAALWSVTPATRSETSFDYF